MADPITLFQETQPSLESYWRSVILFGRNVASYKFALAKSLLEIAPTGKTEITLEELADPFSRHLCEHIAHSPRQVTSSGSHHPLRETLIHQTGATTPDRILFLRKMEADAVSYLIHRWETPMVGEATF